MYHRPLLPLLQLDSSRAVLIKTSQSIWHEWLNRHNWNDFRWMLWLICNQIIYAQQNLNGTEQILKAKICLKVELFLGRKCDKKWRRWGYRDLLRRADGKYKHIVHRPKNSCIKCRGKTINLWLMNGHWWHSWSLRYRDSLRFYSLSPRLGLAAWTDPWEGMTEEFP